MSQQKNIANQQLLESLLAKPFPKIVKKRFNLSTETLNQIISIGGLVFGLLGCIIGLFGCVAAWIVVPKVSESLKLDIPHKAIVTTILFDQLFLAKGPDNTARTMRFVTIELKHIGDQEIRPDDYQRPITFSFPKTSSVTKAYVVVTNTVADINKSELKVRYSGNVALLNKVLLNPGDKYDIVFCVNEEPTHSSDLPFVIDTRIVGMRDSGLIVYDINGKYTHPESLC